MATGFAQSHTTRSWQSLTHFVQVVSAPFSPGLKCAVPADVSVCSLWSVPLYQCVSGFRLDQNQVIRLVNSCRAKAPSETSNFCHSTSLILRKLPEVLVQGRGSLAFLLESDSGTMEWNLKSDFFFFSPQQLGILRIKQVWNLSLHGIRAPPAGVKRMTDRGDSSPKAEGMTLHAQRAE